MRALRLRCKVKNAFSSGCFKRNHGHAVDCLGVAGVVRGNCFVDIEDVQVVHVCLRSTSFEWRITVFNTTRGHLRVEGTTENHALAHVLARITQVLPVRRSLDSKRLVRVYAASRSVELPHRESAAPVLLVVVNWRIRSVQRRRELATLDHPFGVGSNESRAVVRVRKRVFDDLLCLKVLKVYDRNTAIRLLIDKEPLTVIRTSSLGKCRVVCVTPGNVLTVVEVTAVEYVTRLSSVTNRPTLPWLRRKDTDHL